MAEPTATNPRWMTEYWNLSDVVVPREVLLWTVATRTQLARWEHLVARYVLLHGNLPGVDVWAAAIEHHFCLNAARHLLGALDLAGQPFHIDPVVREDIIGARDLHEHWKENMPIFNSMPRQGLPARASGRRFAERNPRGGPFWWFYWDSRVGPKLLPNVAATGVHSVLDNAESYVTDSQPNFVQFIPPREATPWVDDPQNNGWAPRIDLESGALGRDSHVD